MMRGVATTPSRHVQPFPDPSRILKKKDPGAKGMERASNMAPRPGFGLVKGGGEDSATERG